jgi:uncharacterized protein (DUF1697 family)
MVAFLRGVNVGGRLAPMEKVRAAFSEVGCEDVRTYIQSGNLLFRLKGKLDTSFVSRLEERLEGALGFHVPVVLRTESEVVDSLRRNPFAGSDEKHIHLVFLKKPLTKEALELLKSAKSGTERAIVSGPDIYLHLPDGFARAKLPPLILRISPDATIRNLRTTKKLTELARA